MKLKNKPQVYFEYPGNLKTLDLATMVQLYRMRGEPFEVEPGEIIACALTKKLLKSSKKWFGLHYSQKAWDSLLTTNSGGFPLTNVELNILGLVHSPPVEPMGRSFVENNCDVLPQLAFLIINDLKQFGFLEEDENELIITPTGTKALDGIARRLYERKFLPEMLIYYKEQPTGSIGDAQDKQIRLF